MKVLILAPAPLAVSPSQRFRYEQYLNDPRLSCVCQFEHYAFFSSKAWSILFRSNHFFQKSWGVFAGFLRTFLLLFRIHRYDAVYVHRGIAPMGPPFFEWFIARILRKKMIFDFDDAIWVRAASAANPLAVHLKWHSKVKRICAYSQIVSVGNAFLADFAQAYCKDVRIIPTVVNTETHHNQLKVHEEGPLVIGWTGTFTNFGSLETVLPVIAQLQKKYAFEFVIIADKDPKFTEASYRFQRWKAETEIADLMQFSIGIMPLKSEEMEKGKCAFKAIQYMSLGIPPVVSPVGANATLVTDGEDGFWASNAAEWQARLEQLLVDSNLRSRLGKKARARIELEYSVNATRDAFCALFVDSEKKQA